MSAPLVNGEPWAPGIPPGCSAPNGHYAAHAVVLLALEAGWGDEEAASAAASYEASVHDPDWDFDLWYEVLNEAEEYLNDVTEGGVWLWDDGDFRLAIVCPGCGELVEPGASLVCAEHLPY